MARLVGRRVARASTHEFNGCYKLIDLANAAGLSISGVRIAFDEDEISQAAEILHRPPASGDGPAPAAS